MMFLPPIHGAAHDTNFARFIESKSGGFDGSYADYIALDGGPAWTVRMEPSASFTRFLLAKERGFPGSFDTFTREGFSYTVDPGARRPPSAAPSPRVIDRSGGDLFRALDAIRDALGEHARLLPLSDAIERSVHSATTPTDRRTTDALATPQTLFDVLMSETGAPHTRVHFAPTLPQVPAIPKREDIVHPAMTASEARRVLRQIQHANEVMEYRIALGSNLLTEIATPTERREVKNEGSEGVDVWTLIGRT